MGTTGLADFTNHSRSHWDIHLFQVLTYTFPVVQTNPSHIFQHKMSGKYVFSKALKELRFLHCQTSEHSNAVRYALQQFSLRQYTA